MIPDFFFCTAPQSEERYKRATAMLEMWRQVLPPEKLTVLQPKNGDSYHFQSLRRKLAEEMAQTPVYVVADDDMEPSRTKNITKWLMLGCYYLDTYTQFGILSPLLEDTNLFPATVDGSKPFVNDDIQEEHNVGGIRFCRKGVVREWPEQERRGYDQEHCAAYQARGYKVGYMKKLWALHPGHKSETWKPVTDYIAPRLDI